MASYSATVASPWTAEEVFAYLADFRSVAEWDPSIKESRLIDGSDPVKVGATFRVTTRSSVKDVVLTYETIELQPPGKVVLRGENGTMISVDTIMIEPRDDGGSSVTYQADIELKGIRKLADPLMQLGLNRLGDKARAGLREKLTHTSPH